MVDKITPAQLRRLGLHFGSKEDEQGFAALLTAELEKRVAKQRGTEPDTDPDSNDPEDGDPYDYDPDDEDYDGDDPDDDGPGGGDSIDTTLYGCPDMPDPHGFDPDEDPPGGTEHDPLDPYAADPRSAAPDQRPEPPDPIIGECRQALFAEVLAYRDMIPGLTEPPAGEQDIQIEELLLPIRAHNCLWRVGIRTVRQVLAHGDLHDIRGLNEKSIEQIMTAIAEYAS